MKDIGSIFPLYDEDYAATSSSVNRSKEGTENRICYSLCREALFEIAKKHAEGNRVALLPAYTCQTVIDPFIQQGWTCRYYNIKKSLRIDTQDFLRKSELFRPRVVIAHPYLGMELNREELSCLSAAKSKGCIMVEDLTQCILTSDRPSIFDYFTGSYRKWAQLPDGAFLEQRPVIEIDQPESEYDEFVSKQQDSMYLRGQYFQNENQILKDISIRMNKDAVKNISEISKPHKMSEFSSRIWNILDKDFLSESRIENYNTLFNGIHETSNVQLVCHDINSLTTAPLYFPIYVKDRISLQRALAENHVYAPILWPVHAPEVLINEDIKYIYDSILMIPIDQRYDKEDMERIIPIINSYA